VASAAPGSLSRPCTPSSAPAPRRQLRRRTVMMGRTADRNQHRGWPSIRRHHGLEVDLFCLSLAGCIDLVLPTVWSRHEPRSALTYHHGHDHERTSSRPPCARATLPTHPPFFAANHTTVPMVRLVIASFHLLPNFFTLQTRANYVSIITPVHEWTQYNHPQRRLKVSPKRTCAVYAKYTHGQSSTRACVRTLTNQRAKANSYRGRRPHTPVWARNRWTCCSRVSFESTRSLP
jgi:hypothetical protein